MPIIALSQRQCELAVEAFLCLRAGRLDGDRDAPHLADAEELQHMADLVSAQVAPGPPAKGRSVKDILTDEPRASDAELEERGL